jgi:hypothetical protein
MHGPGREQTDWETILALLNHSQTILNTFIDCLEHDPDRAWEAVVELRHCIEEMTHLYPAHTFSVEKPLVIPDNSPLYKIIRVANK